MSKLADFMMQFAVAAKKSPRKVFAGHGVNPNVLQEAITRDDVMAKLGGILFHLESFKKGTVGLKKSPVLKINGYKTFAEFNAKGRADVEKFVEGLPDKDADTFVNNDNIVVIYFEPEKDKSKISSDVSANVTGGRSIELKFDTAVSGEAKSALIGGMYLVVMIGDSAVRKVAINTAKRKATINAKKVSKKMTPAKIKAHFKAKANKQLSALSKERRELEQKARKTRAQLGEIEKVGSMLGVDAKTPAEAITKYNELKAAAYEEVKALSAPERKIFNAGRKKIKEGDKRGGMSLIRSLNNPTITEFVLDGEKKSADDVLKERRKKLRAEIAKRTEADKIFQEKLAKLAPYNATNDPEMYKTKRAYESKASRNRIALTKLKASLKSLGNVTPQAISQKAAILKELDNKISANIGEGKSVVSALQKTLADAGYGTATQEQAVADVVEQVEKGTPAQYAVQQALQKNIKADTKAKAAVNKAVSDTIDENTRRIEKIRERIAEYDAMIVAASGQERRNLQSKKSRLNVQLKRLLGENAATGSVAPQVAVNKPATAGKTGGNTLTKKKIRKTAPKSDPAQAARLQKQRIAAERKAAREEKARIKAQAQRVRMQTTAAEKARAEAERAKAEAQRLAAQNARIESQRIAAQNAKLQAEKAKLEAEKLKLAKRKLKAQVVQQRKPKSTQQAVEGVMDIL